MNRWASVVGFPDYEVSSFGGVINKKTGKALRPTLHGKYLGVSLRRNGKTHKKYIHQMVLEAFVGPRPSATHQASHDNGDRRDNSLSNLAWKTRSENAEDKRRHGTMPLGETHANSFLPEDAVREIRQLYKAGTPVKTISSLFGLKHGTTYQIARGSRWGHVE